MKRTKSQAEEKQFSDLHEFCIKKSKSIKIWKEEYYKVDHERVSDYVGFNLQVNIMFLIWSTENKYESPRGCDIDESEHLKPLVAGL